MAGAPRPLRTPSDCRHGEHRRTPRRGRRPQGSRSLGRRSMIGKGSLRGGDSLERTTRFTMLVPLPQGRAAEPTRLAIAETIVTLPTSLRQSLTWDGNELAQHRQFTVDTGVAVYFAHPRSPWERGTNENTNGLLRQYLPSASVMPSDPATLQAVAARVNGRPRRTLGWRTQLRPSASFWRAPLHRLVETGPC